MRPSIIHVGFSQLSGMIFTGKVDDLTVIDPQNRVWAKTQNGRFQFEAERKFYSSLVAGKLLHMISLCFWKVVKHVFLVRSLGFLIAGRWNVTLCEVFEWPLAWMLGSCCAAFCL